MPPLRLVSLMKAPVTIRMGGDPRNDLLIPPSGMEVTIKKNEKTVCLVGDAAKAAIVYEFPQSAIGIPKEVDPAVRYVVMMVAFEALPDRKDFVTPVRPIRDSSGIVCAYRQLRGHSKDEVARFFEEAAASREVAP